MERKTTMNYSSCLIISQMRVTSALFSASCKGHAQQSSSCAYVFLGVQASVGERHTVYAWNIMSSAADDPKTVLKGGRRKAEEHRQAQRFSADSL